MKRLFLLVVLMCFTSFAFASEVIDTYGLTAAQKATLVIQAEQMKADSTSSVVKQSSSILDQSKQWAEAGKGLAVGMGAGAKEIGVAVNDFAVTPVGRITTAIIVWKMLGKDILGIIVSFAFLAIGLPCMWKLYRFMNLDSATYEDRKGIFGRNYRVMTSVRTSSGDGFVFTAIIYVAANIAVICTAIHILPF